MKLKEPIRKQCQHRSQCARDGIWGVFRWHQGQTDVRPDYLVRVYCGPHKRHNNRNELLRNIRVC